MSKKKGGSGGGSRSSSRGAAAAGAGAGAGGGAGSGSASGGTEQQAAMLRALMQQLGVGGIMSPGVGGGGGGSIFLSREQVLERYRAVYAHTKAGEEQGQSVGGWPDQCIFNSIAFICIYFHPHARINALNPPAQTKSFLRHVHEHGRGRGPQRGAQGGHDARSAAEAHHHQAARAFLGPAGQRYGGGMGWIGSWLVDE